MIKGLVTPVIKSLHGFLILMSLVHISHSMDGDENLYKEDSQPMKREDKPSSVHAPRDQFWEVRNLEITFEKQSEIAGPIILISTPASSVKTSIRNTELIKKVHAQYNGYNLIYDETVLNDTFQHLCQHFDITDPELKNILFSQVKLERDSVLIDGKKNEQDQEQYSSSIESYFEALSRLFQKHINYRVGSLTPQQSLFFDFQSRPLHISKSTFKWAEHLDVYLPRKEGDEIYYDSFTILAHGMALEDMENLIKGEGEIENINFINTLYLKLINAEPKSLAPRRFICKGFDKQNKNLDSYKI
jgi:hypothetical protein